MDLRELAQRAVGSADLGKAQLATAVVELQAQLAEAQATITALTHQLKKLKETT